MGKDTIRTGYFLLQIHNGLEEKFKNDNANRQRIALELEKFFNTINSMSGRENFFTPKVLEEFNTKLSTISKKGLDKFFIYKGKNPNASGKQAEKEIQDIYKAFLAQFLPDIYKELIKKTRTLNKDLKTGKKTKKEKDKIKKDLLLIEGNLGATSGGVGVRQQRNDKTFVESKYYGKRQIKTDFSAIDIFELLGKNPVQIANLKEGLTPEGIKIFDYLSKFKFTIKASKDFDGAKVGTTNPRKVFTAVASACTNYDEKRLNAQYQRAVNSFNSSDLTTTPNPLIIEHGLHIRGAFELVGLGLLDLKQRQEMTDFLIVSNNAGQVEVYDTNSLVYDFIRPSGRGLFLFSSDVKADPLDLTGKWTSKSKNKTSVSIAQARRTYKPKSVQISTK